MIFDREGLFSFFCSSEENLTSSSASSGFSSAFSLSVGSVVWALPEALKKNTFLYLKSLCELKLNNCINYRWLWKVEAMCIFNFHYFHQILSLSCNKTTNNSNKWKCNNHWHRFRYFQASKEILVIINNSLVHFYFFLFFFFFEGGGGPKGLVLVQSWVLFDLSYLQPGERLFKVDF